MEYYVITKRDEILTHVAIRPASKAVPAGLI